LAFKHTKNSISGSSFCFKTLTDSFSECKIFENLKKKIMKQLALFVECLSQRLFQCLF